MSVLHEHCVINLMSSLCPCNLPRCSLAGVRLRMLVLPRLISSHLPTSSACFSNYSFARLVSTHTSRHHMKQSQQTWECGWHVTTALSLCTTAYDTNDYVALLRLRRLYWYNQRKFGVAVRTKSVLQYTRPLSTKSPKYGDTCKHYHYSNRTAKWNDGQLPRDELPLSAKCCTSPLWQSRQTLYATLEARRLLWHSANDGITMV